MREHRNNKHECETPENKTIQMFILNVIIVTYFSQRRMLYGDTTLPSTLRNIGKGATAQLHPVAHGPGLTRAETKLSGS